MKTLKDSKGLKLKPCLNWIPPLTKKTPPGLVGIRYQKLCPCPNFSGEMQAVNGKIVLFACENRKMHQIPVKDENGLPDTPENVLEAHTAKKSSKTRKRIKNKIVKP
jgi:hypothetical protein